MYLEFASDRMSSRAVSIDALLGSRNSFDVPLPTAAAPPQRAAAKPAFRGVHEGAKATSFAGKQKPNPKAYHVPPVRVHLNPQTSPSHAPVARRPPSPPRRPPPSPHPAPPNASQVAKNIPWRPRRSVFVPVRKVIPVNRLAHFTEQAQAQLEALSAAQKTFHLRHAVPRATAGGPGVGGRAGTAGMGEAVDPWEEHRALYGHLPWPNLGFRMRFEEEEMEDIIAMVAEVREEWARRGGRIGT